MIPLFFNIQKLIFIVLRTLIISTLSNEGSLTSAYGLTHANFIIKMSPHLVEIILSFHYSALSSEYVALTGYAMPMMLNNVNQG